MRNKKIVFYGMGLCLALILSYLESLIPFSFGIPGIKLGLANLVILVLLYSGSIGGAILISIMKALIMGFMFGSLSSILYSLAGGVISLLVMALIKRIRAFSIVGVSITGGISHNLGQLLVAGIVVGWKVVIYYVPYLIIAGAVTGLLIGLVTSQVLPHIKGITKLGGNDDSLY